jgi:hypothetical protein
LIGLDTHATSTAVAVAEPDRERPRFLGTVGNSGGLKKALRELGPPSKLTIVYEAGPCGCTLARNLTAAGYVCHVVAHSRIPRCPGVGSRLTAAMRSPSRTWHEPAD